MSSVTCIPAPKKTLISRLTLCVLMVSCLSAARAATFTIDTTSDTSLTACTAAPNDCSLRGALTAANLTTALDQIHFDIPQSDAGFQSATQHWRISVGSTALPAISEAVVIDGFTQAGAIANTNTPAQGGLNGVLKIEIVPGSTFGNQQNGIDTFSNNFAAPASTIRGLAISRFFAQIVLGGGSAHRVEGCYLGTDITGTVAAVTTISGRGTGVRLQSQGAYQIGGTLPGQRNLLSGLSDAVVQQSLPDGVVIAGNLFGTNAAGTQAIPNTSIALSFLQGGIRNARIGGTDPLARNVISASGFWAIALSAQGSTPFASTRIEGNYIGTDWTGTRALGNGLNPNSPSQVTAAIKIGGIVACDLVIGGANPGQANVIAFSGKQGVENDQCRGLQAADNVYIGNRDAAFDNVVGGDAIGLTPNDPGDADDNLGNRGQNYPELSLGNPSQALVQYRVDTAIANASYPITVNFFRAGCGGGALQRVASASISAAQAQQSLMIDLSATNYLPLTAVAVDAAGNQSEFAPAIGDAIFRSDFEDVTAPLRPGQCF
jgi:hypothetical protein